jgi:hypothetical protein
MGIYRKLKATWHDPEIREGLMLLVWLTYVVIAGICRPLMACLKAAEEAAQIVLWLAYVVIAGICRDIAALFLGRRPRNHFSPKRSIDVPQDKKAH